MTGEERSKGWLVIVLALLIVGAVGYVIVAFAGRGRV